MTPLIFGTYSDNFGYKRTIAGSFSFIILGYLLLGTQTDFIPFLLGAVVLGFGSGMFKPALQGALSHEINSKDSGLSWSIYFMLLNISVFIAAPLTKTLKEYSWDYVFAASIIIILINALILLLYKNENLRHAITHASDLNNKSQKSSKKFTTYCKSLKESISVLAKPQIWTLLLIISGFSIIYMQFYETLPNFIYDWLDTSKIVTQLNLPKFMTMTTGNGIEISYEWLYNINTFCIIFGVVFVNLLFSRINRLYAILIGISSAILGLAICGSACQGNIFIFGIIIYTFGEMTVNPKITDHFSTIAPNNSKAMYLSFLNISYMIGLAGGSLLGGNLYNQYGEKAGLAAKYLQMHYGIKANLTDSINKIQQIERINISQLNSKLWNEFHPEYLWIPFIVVGIIAVIGLIIYISRFKQKYN